MKIHGYIPKSQQVLVQIRKKHHKRYVFPMVFVLVMCGAIGYLSYDILKIWNNGIKLVTKVVAKSVTPTLRAIQVSGNERVSREEVIKLSGLYQGANILTLNLQQVRTAIRNNDWIRDVSIRRVFPDTVQIVVEERVIGAIWYYNDKYYCISNTGEVVTEINPKDVKDENLLLLGDGAPQTYVALNSSLIANGIIAEVKSLERIGNRRWNLYLKAGTVVKLPEDGSAHTLQQSIQTLSKILTGKTSDYAIIDLRLIPDKIYINK